MQDTIDNKFHLDRIDFLRGVAAILVFLFHCQSILFPNFEIKKYNSNHLLDINGIKNIILNFSLIGNGRIGVELFLVISGFLIHLIYIRSQKTYSIKTFYSKRFWRIYPPYLLALIFFYFTIYGFGKSHLKDFFIHFFLLHDFLDSTFYSINLSFWSIALEMQLYLIYPIFLFIRKKMGITKAFVFIVLVSAISFVCSSLFTLPHFEHTHFSIILNFWVIWCAGAYLAENFNKNKRIFKNSLLCLIAFSMLFILSKLNFYSSKLAIYIATAACVAFFEMVIYSPYYLSRNLVIKYFLKIISFVGICSYSLYLIHMPILCYLLPSFFLQTGKILLNISIQILPSFLILLFISYISYKLIEINSVKLGTYLRKRNS